MIRKVLIVVIAMLTLHMSTSQMSGTLGKPHAPKKYIVNLDLPPEQRWREVILDNKDLIIAVRDFFREKIPVELVPYVELIATNIDNYLSQPYASEMRGIAAALNISLGDVVLANLMYDATAFCTSIVSQDTAGRIWHSRNLDYRPADLLKNITIAVDFQAQGQTVYSAVTYAGIVGVLTGQRPKVFTITIDERDQGSFLWNVIIGVFDKAVSVTFLIRDALANDETYDAAVKRLSYTTTAADAYFIVGGVRPGEGAVITKGRLAADDIWTLDADNGRWYLVETNYDHWKDPPADDDRRHPAMKSMNAMGQGNITLPNLFNIL